MSSQHNTTVAIYKTHPEAEFAIHELQKAGFDMRHLSFSSTGHKVETSLDPDEEAEHDQMLQAARNQREHEK